MILNVIMRGACCEISVRACGSASCIRLQDVHAAFARLRQRDRHDFLGDALDLDVHLQRGDAAVGAGHLEVHVAQVILVAEDVGQHREAVAFLDEAHRDAGDVRLGRHAGVHQREAAAADRGHRRAAVRLGDLRDDAHRVREFLGRRQHGEQRALGEAAVADLAALRRADAAGLAGRVRRHVVVEHEAVAVLAHQRVDASARRARCRACATTSACVSPRVNSAEPCVRGSTPVRIVIGRTVRVSRPSMRGSPARIWLRTIFASSSNTKLLTCVRVAGRRVGGHALGGDLGVDFLQRAAGAPASGAAGRPRAASASATAVTCGDHRLVLRRRLPVPQRLAALFDELVDQLDHRLLLLVAEHDGAEHHFLGQLVGFGFDHQHRGFGAGDDEVRAATSRARSWSGSARTGRRCSRRARRRSGR